MKHPLLISLFLVLAAAAGAQSFWTGTISTDWHDPDNWSAGVPTNATPAEIYPLSSARYPAINSAPAYCQNLYLFPGASLTVGTANLYISNYTQIWGQLNMTQATDIHTGGDIEWVDGASVNIQNGSAEIFCGRSMYFWPDANVQFSQGYLEFNNSAGTNAYIHNDSPATILPNLRSHVAAGAYLFIHGFSVEDIVINGSFWNYQGSSFRCAADVNIRINGNFRDYNTTAAQGVYLQEGTLVMNGANQTLELVEGRSLLNNLSCEQSGTLSLNGHLDLRKNLSLNSGIFDPGAWGISLGGDWIKNTSHDSFSEGSSLVSFTGPGTSHVYGEEDFADVELAKSAADRVLEIPAGSSLICDSYDWTLGTLTVSGGLFYAHGMVDTVILGTVNLSAGSIILVQDTAHTLGLRGQLNISGGEMHIWGGSEGVVTAMPSGGDAGLTMSDGLLYRHGWGIGIYNNAYAFNANISGGVIRTDQNFYCDRADFSPSGGELELAGTANSYLTVTGPGLQELRINKGSDASVMLMSDLDLNGLLTVDSGSFDLNSNHIHTTGSIIVHGTMMVNGNSWLYLNNLCYLNVESGGRLEAIGYPGSLVAINTDAGYFYFNVRSGATIAASYCLFAQMSQYGVYVRPGASIDPDHSFDNCRFSWGVAGGALLTIDNSDHVGIISPQFLTDAGGGASNVRKTVDAGIVNIVNSTGYFSGEEYDDDVYGRVLWNAGNDQPDLQIIAAEWVPDSPEPYLGDYRDLKVTVVNNSISPLVDQLFYLDLYYNRYSAPPLQEWGDLFIGLEDLPAGLPVDVTFSDVAVFYPPMSGTWSSWLQIDSDERITESDESNNVYGPFYITWQELPTIDNLSIAYDPVSGLATLNWSYPIGVTKFNVYSDTDPFGGFSASAGWSTTTSFTFAPGLNNFFRVRAERLPAAKSRQDQPRTAQRDPRARKERL